jgi:uncharacterized Ntn-hydrolase superfamily protein
MYAGAGAGALATQALANTRYGPEGLALLRDGLDARQVATRLTGADELSAHRQLGVVDATGRSASYTGESCIPWAGGRAEEGVAAQGNILAGESVLEAMLDTFRAGKRPFPELLVQALAAADEQGGDRRGRQAAALLVVREGGGYGGLDDRWIDLRVDDHSAPTEELARLLELTRLYRDRPRVEELVAIDETLAAELRTRLSSVGYEPGREGEAGFAMLAEAEGVARTGEPRQMPDGWDEAWQAALGEWMAVENLEERMAAGGWIDPRVLEFLRSQSEA